jgi:hypothetical protein
VSECAQITCCYGGVRALQYQTPEVRVLDTALDDLDGRDPES